MEIRLRGTLLSQGLATRGFGWRTPLGTPQARADWCFELGQMLRAGLPLLESLHALAGEDAPFLTQPRARSALARRLMASIENGRSFSQALAYHPRVFDGTFVRFVQVGEASGRLAETMAELAGHLHWQAERSQAIRRALLYPIFASVLVLGASIFLLLYLLPRLESFAGSLGVVLPWYTRALLAISHGMQRVETWMCAALLLLPATGYFLGRYAAPNAALRQDRLLLALPAIGASWRQFLLSRFCRQFALLYTAGLPVLDALALMEHTIGNCVLARALATVRVRIENGQPMGVAFATPQGRSAPFFDPPVLRMIALGERTGALDTALTHVSDFYDRAWRARLARLEALIGPGITLLLGTLLALVIVSVLGPVYTMLGQVRF